MQHPRRTRLGRDGLWISLGLFLGLFSGQAALVEGARDGAEPEPAQTLEPQVVTEFPQAARGAGARLRVAPGLEVRLWASEPLIENITSLDFDGLGRAYVVETGRRRTSVFDIRGLQPWLDDDFAFRTVQDRADFLKKMLTPGTPGHEAFLEAVTRAGRGGFQDFNQDGVVDWRDLEVESERIRLVWASDDGPVADRSMTFVEPFDSSVSGVAAGVLAWGDSVWFTCVPDLWRFPAASGDREKPEVVRAPQEEHRLLTGFGVHIAFGGHDLHGLAMGPDGRLYFSIADRGIHVTNRENDVVALPDTGAVFRCEPDGSHFELYATGLRNPQELAFDDFGNLWTGDNNGDGGDKARWTWVLEGADYGWTLGWQWLPGMGGWNQERLWEMQTTNSAAYIVPPVAHVGHGPAGIAWYPGTGLGSKYQDHFFYTDFPGGVRVFQVEPEGAFFRIPDAGRWLEDNSGQNPRGKLLWDLYPVDVTFPPGGGVMVADWVRGWEKTGQARIWHVRDPRLDEDPQIAETQRLLAEHATPPGWTDLPMADLARLLGHVDQRVRMAAQDTLTQRDAAEIVAILETHESQRARWLALYALERQRRRQGLAAEAVEWIPRGLSDPEMEVRALAARLAGEWFPRASVEPLLELAAKDPHPRVVAHALMALRLDEVAPQDLQPLVDQLHQVADRSLGTTRTTDPALFHGVTRAMQRAGRGAGLIWVAGLQHRNPNVRLATIVAARRVGTPFLIQGLNDRDPRVVLETVRAIHDPPIRVAQPALLDMLDPDGGLASRWLGFTLARSWQGEFPFEPDEWNAWITRRLINAHFRAGNAQNAERIVAYAARPGNPESLRAEALEVLALWPKPPARDRVTGLIAEHRRRSETAARREVLEALDAWLERLPLPGAQEGLGSFEDTMPPAVQVAFLSLLGTLNHDRAPVFAQLLLEDANEAVRQEAARWIPRETRDTPDWIARATDESLGWKARQEALAVLKADGSETAKAWLTEQLGTWEAGEWPGELALDLVEALQGIADPEIDARMEALALKKSGESVEPDPEAVPFPYELALAGGDPVRGKRLFVEQADWGCARCHRFDGEGGQVGPDLTGIGDRMSPQALFKAIVDPNADLAEGYETLWLDLIDGRFLAGVGVSENEETLVLRTEDGSEETIPVEQIASRERGLSMMPEGLVELMSLRDLRDLLAALAASR